SQRSFRPGPSALPSLSDFRKNERRLDPAMVERLLEAIERSAHPDEPVERVGPAPPRLLERLDRSAPVAAPRVHAAEDDAVADDDVEAEEGAGNAERAVPRIDPEETADAAAAEQADRVHGRLGIAGRLDHEVEAAELAGERSERPLARGD